MKCIMELMLMLMSNDANMKEKYTMDTYRHCRCCQNRV